MSNGKFIEQMQNAYDKKNEHLRKISKMPLSLSRKTGAKGELIDNLSKVKESCLNGIRKEIELAKSKKEQRIWEEYEKLQLNKEKILENLRKKVEEHLKQISEMPLSEEIKKEAESQIIDNFNKASEIYLNKIKEKIELAESKEEKRLQEEYERLQIFWNKEKILENLKKSVRVEENVEVMWFEWKNIHINLPAVWKFKWFKFDYFVSDYSCSKAYFEKNSKYENRWFEKRSYSMKEVWELLKAMNKYMQAMGVETDWGMDYENDLKYWEIHNEKCYAWDCLKNILGLDGCYWLKDKNVRRENSRVEWCCRWESCHFEYHDYDSREAKLFLKLS